MKILFVYFVFFFLCLQAYSISPNVKINGSVSDLKLSIAKLLIFDPILAKDSIVVTKKIDENNGFVIEFYLKEPNLFKLMNLPIFITPGDTINIKLDGLGTKLLAFDGRNEGNYRLLSELQKKYKYYPPDKYFNRWNVYFDSVKTNFSQRTAFIDSFVKAYSTTDNFVNFVQNDINFKYKSDLILPVVLNKATRKTISDLYLKNIIINKFDDSFIIYPKYIWFIQEYNIYMDEQSDNEIPIKSLINRVKIADSIFQGKTQEIAYIKLIDNFVKQGNHINDLKLFDECVINYIKPKISEPNFRKRLEDIYILYHLTDTPLPIDVLNTFLIDTSGQKIIFKDIISKYSNKKIYIDFWASWCGPCIEQMSNLSNLINKLGNTTEVLLLSIDKDTNQWLKATKKNPFKANSYKIDNQSLEVISKTFNLIGIPRYMILNKKHNLLQSNAAKPSEINKLLQVLEVEKTDGK